MADQVNLGSVFIDLRVKTDNVQKDVAKASTELKQQIDSVAKSATSAAKQTSGLGAAFSQIGKGLLGGFGIGAGLLGIQAVTQTVVNSIGKVLADFRKFEDQIANIATVVGGSKETLQQFGDGIKEIAKSSRISIDDLANASYDIASAGITDVAQNMKVLGAANKLAVAGLGSAKEAVDILTSAINAYGISADDAEAVANAFFSSVNYGKTTVSQLAQGFGAAAPILAQAGITFEEVAASVGALTASGRSASEVYTGLESIAGALLKPNEDMIKVFDKLGVQTGLELVKKFGGLKGAMQQITTTSKQLGLTVAEVTGRKEAQSAATALLTTSSEAYDKQLQALLAGENNLDKAYQEKMKTQQANIDMLKNQLSVVMLNLAGKVAPFLGKALALLIEFFLDFFNSMKATYYGIKLLIQGFIEFGKVVGKSLLIVIGNSLNKVFETINKGINKVNDLIGGAAEKLGIEAKKLPTIDFRFNVTGLEESLLNGIDEGAGKLGDTFEKLSDSFLKIGNSNAQAKLDELGKSYARIKQQVAEVDPEFQRAGKSQDDAKKKAEEALKTYGDLSKAIQDSVQDRLKFFATESQNTERLQDVLADTKLSVADLSSAWREATSNINQQMKDLQDNHKKVGVTLRELQDLAKSYGKVSTDANKQVYKSYEELNAQLDKTREKINDILSQLKEIDDQSKKNADDFEKNVVQTIVDAEQRIAQLRDDLAKEQRGDSPSQDRINDLQKEIQQQQAILDYAKQQQLGNEADLAEERKKRSFNALQLLQYEFEQQQKQLQERKVTLQKELDAQLAIVEDARAQEAELYEATKNAIVKLEEEITSVYQKNLNDRIAATTAFVNKADAEYKRLASIVAAALALQTQRLGLPNASTPPSYPSSPSTGGSSTGATTSSQNITINPTVNSQADWSQIGQQLGFQLRGAQ